MSYFLTQCPFCQTSFKVNEDQMHVANGVVRCGACMEVFLAGQHRIVLKDKAAHTDLPESDKQAGESTGGIVIDGIADLAIDLEDDLEDTEAADADEADEHRDSAEPAPQENHVAESHVDDEFDETEAVEASVNTPPDDETPPGEDTGFKELETTEGAGFGDFLNPSGYRMTSFSVDHIIPPLSDIPDDDNDPESSTPVQEKSWVFEEEPGFPEIAPLGEDNDFDMDGAVSFPVLTVEDEQAVDDEDDNEPFPTLTGEEDTPDSIDDDLENDIEDDVRMLDHQACDEQEEPTPDAVPKLSWDDNSEIDAGVVVKPADETDETGDTFLIQDTDDALAEEDDIFQIPGPHDGESDIEANFQEGSAGSTDHETRFVPPAASAANDEDGILADPGLNAGLDTLGETDTAQTANIPSLEPDLVAREGIPGGQAVPESFRGQTPAGSSPGIAQGEWHDSNEAGDDKAALHDHLAQLTDEDSLEPVAMTSLSAIDDMPIELAKAPNPRSKLKTAALVITSLLLVVALAGQYLWYHLDTLVRDRQLPEVTALLCQWTKCPDPAAIDLNTLVTEELVVRSHPREKDALLVDFIFRNDADHEQPFPLVELNFTDNSGSVLANRVFSAEEYLPSEMSLFSFMPAHSSIQVSLALVDPGPEATGYSLIFRNP